MRGTLDGPHLCPEAGGTIFNVDHYYNDAFFWEPDNFLRQNSYGPLDARIKYKALAASAS
jgi:hypothetical protein